MVRQVPEGQVVSYGDVAAALGAPRYARHVGWALAALTPDLGVPWQRVILASGHVAFRGDPIRGSLQRSLLVSEGVTFRGERVDLKAHRWCPPPGTWIDPLLDGALVEDDAPDEGAP